MIVLEMMPDRVAAAHLPALRIPTIGIGAGGGCDGQVLVLHDLLGIFDRFTPKFVKQYAALAPKWSGRWPSIATMWRPAGSRMTSIRFPMDEAEWEEWVSR